MKKKDYIALAKKSYEEAKELVESKDEDRIMSKMSYLNTCIQNDVGQIEATLYVCAIVAATEEQLGV